MNNWPDNNADFMFRVFFFIYMELEADKLQTSVHSGEATVLSQLDSHTNREHQNQKPTNFEAHISFQNNASIICKYVYFLSCTLACWINCQTPKHEGIIS